MKRIMRMLATGALVMMSAPACSRSNADMFETAQTNVVTLGKFVTLSPAPLEAKWSVATIGTDAVPGPSDTMLWAVVRYSEADFATITRALKADGTLRTVTVNAPPAWLLADVDLARFRRGSDYVIEGQLSAGTLFASDLYGSGFALVLPNRRVLIHFSTQ